MRFLSLALLATWLLALPGLARDEYARYDLDLNRVLLEQTRVVLEAGTLLENWQKGRGALSNSSARAALEKRRAQAARLVARLEKLSAPSAAASLRKVALVVARGRVDLIREARDFVAQGNPRSASQKAFVARTLSRTGELQARWLSDRLEAARSVGGLTPPLQAYYRWQTQLLPLTRTQVKIGTDIQRLVLLNQAGTAELPDLIKQAGEATQASFVLRDKAGQIQVPAALAEAHKQARAEQAALSELCAEVKAYTGDRSEESITRVSRATRELRQASLAAEQASLNALAAALGPASR